MSRTAVAIAPAPIPSKRRFSVSSPLSLFRFIVYIAIVALTISAALALVRTYSILGLQNQAYISTAFRSSLGTPPGDNGRSDGSTSPDLFNSWRRGHETCDQWIQAQRMANSYLDAYVIGVQKGATSELTKRLYKLGVRCGGRDMSKEWHFFSQLDAKGNWVPAWTSHMGFDSSDLKRIRLTHYQAGHPKKTITLSTKLPLVDNSPRQNRTIVYDSTVEYMHSERSAFISHLLTPHAKVILTIRNPVDRVVSQYNMMIRLHNHSQRDSQGTKRKATPRELHKIVSTEIKALVSCGYDSETAKLNGTTTDLQRCVIMRTGDYQHHVMRGLYHLHILSWRKYYPDHRMHYILFEDALQANENMLQDVTKFLCVRPFSRTLLDLFKKNATNVSFGMANALYGEFRSKDDDYRGKNRYLARMLPKTEALLEEFYGPANRQLEHLLGRKAF